MKTKLALTLLLVNAAVQAELVPQGENTGVGARAVSLGGAFTAIADDYSALYYNPAGMTQLSRSELGLNLAYRLTANDATPDQGSAGSRSLETTRVNDVSLVLTQGNGLAFGMGYYSPTSYEDPLAYFARGQQYDYEDMGSMNHYRMAVAYAPSANASVGFAATFLSGEEQLQIQDGGMVRDNEEYGGFNLEPSFLLQLSDKVSFGGSVVMVERLALHDTYQEQGQDPIVTDYSIRNPFQTRLGLAFQLGRTQLSLDWHGVYWSSYAYALAGSGFYQNEPDYANQNIFAVGVEHKLMHQGPVLRAGLSWEAEDPIPSSLTWIQHPVSVNFGIGLPVSQYVSVDMGYQFQSSTYAQPSTANGPVDLTIAQSGQQAMGSLRLRW